jgi:hypothetical protein
VWRRRSEFNAAGWVAPWSTGRFRPIIDLARRNMRDAAGIDAAKQAMAVLRQTREGTVE